MQMSIPAISSTEEKEDSCNQSQKYERYGDANGSFSAT